jgi:hypothetical protein
MWQLFCVGLLAVAGTFLGAYLRSLMLSVLALIPVFLVAAALAGEDTTRQSVAALFLLAASASGIYGFILRRSGKNPLPAIFAGKPRIRFSAPIGCHFDEAEQDQKKSKQIILRLLRARHPEQFSDHFDHALEFGVTGGSLRFRYDAKAKMVFAVTEYVLSRPLKDTEIHELKEYTFGQWLDGIGDNFSQAFMDEAGAALSWPVNIDELTTTAA